MSQRKLVEPMGEGGVFDLDAQGVAHGEVRQREPSRRMFMGKVDLAFGTEPLRVSRRL